MRIDHTSHLYCFCDLIDRNGKRIRGVEWYDTVTKEARLYVDYKDGEFVRINEISRLGWMKHITVKKVDATLVCYDKALADKHGIMYMEKHVFE